MRTLYDLLGLPSHSFDATHRYTTSWLLPPLLLGCLRLSLAIYCFVTIFFIFGWHDSHHNSRAVRQSFSYFTNLTYWGLAFYFLFSSLHTLSYARTGHAWLQSWPRPMQAAHAVFYTTVVTFPILVTAVFWAILYNGHWFPIVFMAWSNTSQHALNTVFACFEIFIPRTGPPPLLHLLILIILLALYLGLAYLTKAVEGFYPYSFLDTSKGSGRVAAYAFGILAAIIVIFGVVWLVIWLRRWLTERKLGLQGNFGKGAGTTYSEQQDIPMASQEVK